jgi:dTDP-glucose 4,6-dehydratase
VEFEPTIIPDVVLIRGHDRRYAVDCAKIEQELGFSQRVTLLEGLQDTFAWYVNNESWWKRS